MNNGMFPISSFKGDILYDQRLVQPAPRFVIDNIPPGYSALRLNYSMRSDRAFPADRIRLTINDDSAANKYESMLFLWYDPSSWATTDPAVNNIAHMTFICGSTALANSFGGGFFEFPDYDNQTNLKLIQARGGMMQSLAIQPEIYDGMAVWRDTAPITKIVLTPNLGTNFVANSRVTLIGM